jgi:hypothetical protein
MQNRKMSSTINDKATSEHVLKAADKQVTTFQKKEVTAKLFRDIS